MRDLKVLATLQKKTLPSTYSHLGYFGSPRFSGVIGVFHTQFPLNVTEKRNILQSRPSRYVICIHTVTKENIENRCLN